MNLDPSSVLDFLTACVYLQKNWSSADETGSAAGNHVAKHDNIPKDVLCLNNGQVFAMVDYVLQEMLHASQGAADQGRNSMRDVGLQRIP